MKSAIVAVAAAMLAVAQTGPCLAQNFVATEQMASDKMVVRLQPGYANATLSIGGPNNFHASTASKSGSVELNLSQFGALEDGTYTYQITASTAEKMKARPSLNNGRDREGEPLKSVAMSGTFNIQGGKLVKPDPTIREDNRRPR